LRSDLPADWPCSSSARGAATPGLNASIDRFAAEALAGDLPVTPMNHPSAPHAFDVMDKSEPTRELIRQMPGFLRARLPGSRPARSGARVEQLRGLPTVGGERLHGQRVGRGHQHRRLGDLPGALDLLAHTLGRPARHEGAHHLVGHEAGVLEHVALLHLLLQASRLGEEAERLEERLVLLDAGIERHAGTGVVDGGPLVFVRRAPQPQVALELVALAAALRQNLLEIRT
jgi:hypothetical protein